jgi:ABC-type nitrate/sulfonate/bicarbonate transport system permease component
MAGFRRIGKQVFVFLILLALWQIVGALKLGGPSLPSLSATLAVFQTQWMAALLLRSAAATLREAGSGFLIGGVLGAATALLAYLVPPLRTGLDRLAVLIYALPAIALAPVLIITAGRQGTPVALASIPVFFLIYVAARDGLEAASSLLANMLTALGGGRWKRLTLLDAPAALPSLLNGVKASISAAMIGAIVGEWFGASRGLGIVILNTMQNFQIPLMWATVLVTATISLLGYALAALLERAMRRRFT